MNKDFNQGWTCGRNLQQKSHDDGFILGFVAGVGSVITLGCFIGLML